MSESRTSYIASVTIVQRAGNAMPQIYYAKSAISAVFKRPLVVISCHNYNPHSSNMTALNKFYVALST